jgi:hypothetical protein
MPRRGPVYRAVLDRLTHFRTILVNELPVGRTFRSSVLAADDFFTGRKDRVRVLNPTAWDSKFRPFADGFEACNARREHGTGPAAD